MINSFIRNGKIKRWLSRPECPAFISDCKTLLDKALGQHGSLDDDNLTIADSAYEAVPIELQGLFPTGKPIALRARHKFDDVIFARARTHIGNSLILYYPGGDTSKQAVPASIQYIVARRGKDDVFVVKQQLQAPMGTIDPFSFYPHFPAKIYSTMLSEDLQIVRPQWIFSHYARWKLDEHRAVVLTLSRVSVRHR